MRFLTLISPLLALPAILALMPLTARAQAVLEPAQRDTIRPFILDSIEISTGEVFDFHHGILRTVGDVLNALHVVTHESVIRDEVFFEIGDTVDSHELTELERNLENSELYSEVDLQVIAYEGEEKYRYPYAILRITTRDAWSLRGTIGFDQYHDQPVYRVSGAEVNTFGTGDRVGLGVESSPGASERPWRISGSVFDPNIAGTFVRTGIGGAYSRLEQTGRIVVDRPYYADRAPFAFSTTAGYFTGDDPFYFDQGATTAEVLVPTSRFDAAGWYSVRAGGNGDVFRTTAQVRVNSVTHPYDSATPVGLTRAFDNTVGIYAGISSVRRRFVVFRDADFNGDQLVPIGGAGSVTLGGTFAFGQGTDNLFYIGAEASNAALVYHRLYLYGHVAAGTGVEPSTKRTRYTLETAQGGGLLLIRPGVLAARLSQTTVWNWPRYLFNPLDETDGLRGYAQLSHIGDNRIVGNLEYRLVPVVTLPLIEVGVTGFYDIGAVWNQGEHLSNAQFHSSIGPGIRIASSTSRFASGLFRLDIPFRLDGGRPTFDGVVASISYSTSEFFTPFGDLEHRPPQPYRP